MGSFSALPSLNEGFIRPLEGPHTRPTLDGGGVSSSRMPPHQQLPTCRQLAEPPPFLSWAMPTHARRHHEFAGCTASVNPTINFKSAAAQPRGLATLPAAISHTSVLAVLSTGIRACLGTAPAPDHTPHPCRHHLLLPALCDLRAECRGGAWACWGECCIKHGWGKGGGVGPGAAREPMRGGRRRRARPQEQEDPRAGWQCMS